MTKKTAIVVTLGLIFSLLSIANINCMAPNNSKLNKLLRADSKLEFNLNFFSQQIKTLILSSLVKNNLDETKLKTGLKDLKSALVVSKSFNKVINNSEFKNYLISEILKNKSLNLSKAEIEDILDTYLFNNKKKERVNKKYKLEELTDLFLGDTKSNSLPAESAEIVTDEQSIKSTKEKAFTLLINIYPTLKSLFHSKRLFKLVKAHSYISANNENLKMRSFAAIAKCKAKGADFNFQDENGNSCLTYAIYKEDEELISLLLSLGADPLTYALNKNDSGLVNSLLDHYDNR